MFVRVMFSFVFLAHACIYLDCIECLLLRFFPAFVLLCCFIIIIIVCICIKKEVRGRGRERGLD